MLRALRSSAALALAIGLLAVAAPQPAAAEADASQICRSGMNLLLFPFDVALSPFITAKDMYYGLTEVDDEPLIQVFVTLPGYVYLNSIQVGGALIRAIAGVFEIPGGIAALFTGNASGALYRSQDESWQMFSSDVGPCPIRFGTSYNTINEG